MSVIMPHTATSRRPLRVIQISDPHWHVRADTLLNWGIPGSIVSTDATLEAVLAEVANESPDAVLVTGDLAQEPEAATYSRLAHALESLDCPVFCLPGNHDDAQIMHSALPRAMQPENGIVDLDAWRFVLLDSSIPGQSAGRLGAERLATLKQVLAERPDVPTLLALHHHPLPVQSPWLDRMALEDGPALLAAIGAHPQVRAVAFGHIHQAFVCLRDDVSYLGAPSTCIQFVPHSGHLAIDSLPPGYRRMTLHPDGNLQTEVVFLRESLDRLA